jgi:hypothetical protein
MNIKNGIYMQMDIFKNLKLDMEKLLDFNIMNNLYI